MLDKLIRNRLDSIRNLVGNTPLLAIHLEYKGEPRTIYAKAEHYNLTGSIKDRMALHILQKGYEEGALKPGDRIVEATSGNTGISLAAVGSYLGHPVTIFLPEWMSMERKKLIRSFGASIELVSAEQGGFLGSIRMTEELEEAEDNVFLPRQFSNENNSEAHYLTTGPEINAQLEKLGLQADAFISGIGTGGTLMGIGRCLREKNPDIRLYPLEPASSPTMSTGYKVGKHRIQGISDEFIPSLVDLEYLDDILAVDDGDAIIMAQMLARDLGLGVGISSGANFIGALMAMEKLGRDAVIVTVFSDDNKKYLSTDLLSEEPVKEGFLSSHVKLMGISCDTRKY